MISRLRKCLLENRNLTRLVFSIYSSFNLFEVTIINLLPSFIRYVYFKTRFKAIGNQSFIDHGFYFRYPKRILIGNRVEINRDCSFYPAFLKDQGKISIGDNSILAPHVRIFCAGHTSTRERNHIVGDVVIGENVYIGAGSILRYGIVIGDNATIGAGSVVVCDVEEFAVYAGNPAKFIYSTKSKNDL